MNWRNYTPAELEREYTPASLVENIQIYLDEYTKAGTRSREAIRHTKLQYGAHSDEWLWLARNSATNKNEQKLIVFVHGGFWRRLSADDGTFLTRDFHRLGFDFASINYSLCPNEPLETLVDQTSRAIQFLTETYKTENITLIGHSAGAHLVAMALNSKPQTKFARAILVSGIFDLIPLIHTSINDVLKLDEESAQRLSPINFVSHASNTKLTIIWGENETDEFKRQSHEFASAWTKAKTNSQIYKIEISGRNHFDILYDLSTTDVIDLPSA